MPMTTPGDLNFKHLRYLWLVAREGSVTAAARACGVEQSAVSTQLKCLEGYFKQRLFEKVGRRLRLTDAGRVALGYADDIFRLGRELEQAVRAGGPGPQRVTIGVVDVLPKLLVYKLIEPVYALPDSVRLVVLEDTPTKLLAALALGEVDLVLADAQEAAPRVKVFYHSLGECGVTFFAAGHLAAARKSFPHSLDGLPFLLPTEPASLRRSLDQWFDAVGVRPDVRGEFADSALLKVFGQAGRGAFALPTAVEREVTTQFDVKVIGRVDAVRERFYAVTAERKLTHPAVLAIRDAARHELFADRV
jgi:LysR family transcriptional activator of nhaA